MEFYENPHGVPLESLQLKVDNDGMVIAINALNSRWIDKRYVLHYEMPQIYNDDGSEIPGTKQHWMEVTNYIIEDLNWLLHLPFYRFWSNIVYNTSIMDTLISFLQEAPPFYALENFPTIPEMLETLEKLRYNVLMVFARLVTNKESLTEYMNRPFHGNLLYDNYLFTIPIIFDLCQLYGRDNAKVTKKLIQSVFSLQPMYLDDLRKSVPCLIKALENVERRFKDCPVDITEAVALSEKENNYAEMTLYNLEDLILYILDISSTLTVLLQSYSPIIAIFHTDDFMNKIVLLYGNTIPEMYKKLDKLAYNEENMPKYIELKHRLDVTRVEILNLFRIILYEPILDIFKKLNTITEDETRNCIDEYLNLLMNAISEKEFIVDYHQFYPIGDDLETVSKLCPEIDTIKREYILHSLYTSIGETKMPANAPLNYVNVPVAGTSGIQSNQQDKQYNDVNHINNKTESTFEDPEKLMSLISNVKEILCDCGEGFIQLCLKHYNYNVESVINAVIEDSLPPNLKDYDTQIPYIPPDPMEPSAAVDLAIGVQRLNIFDNDKFDIMTNDVIDNSKIHVGKRDKYRNANEMLNDKSEIKKSRNIYEKYTIIDDYDDEYDDTYDSHNIRDSAPDDSTEIDARPFTIPRVFRASNKNNASSEDETEVEDEKPTQNNDHFVSNPAELRAKTEQRKQSSKDSKNAHDVIGNPKGQGQNKDVLTNRHKKNVRKATHGNHNRRMGSQIKRKQGMIPS
ncbi:activating signal cointegrator 1 complex subunit 2 isoform X2 [Linepithema humile]|uniref:activating signal cointegrator 1 complex subunit 2 isoform X2 n=1 Tax=Linepithema humile TaxID=83485 RepID=UPI00351DBBB9